MIISLITRGLIMALGYLYPAYECFKIVELNRPEVEQLRFWCQYWIIVALVTVVERVGDPLISWVPMYSEAKLAFFVYLWYPRTMGTAYFYSTFVRPFVSMHEHDIDQNLNELRTRAGDVAYVYWTRGSTYFQARFFELLQYLASQSASSQATGVVPNMYPPRPVVTPGFAAAAGMGAGRGAGIGGNQPSAPQQPGTYPTAPPGVMRGSGGSGGLGAYHQSSAAQGPPAAAPGMYPGGVAGPLRSRSAEDVDGFQFVDGNAASSAPPYGSAFPDATAAPGGYLTRSRQRASTDRTYPPP